MGGQRQPEGSAEPGLCLAQLQVLTSPRGLKLTWVPSLIVLQAGAVEIQHRNFSVAEQQHCGYLVPALLGRQRAETGASSHGLARGETLH